MFSRNRLSAVAVFLAIFFSAPAYSAGNTAAPAVAATPAIVAAQAASGSAAAQAAEHGKEVNPYGISALWNGSDFVAKGTLLILLLFSIGSWYIIVAKLLAQRKLHKQARDTERTFWDAGTVRQGLDTLESGTPFHFIGTLALKATEHHSGLLAHVDFNTWVVQSLHSSVDTVKNRLQDGLAFLATVGSTAPFVGLFGTVWGIYHALTAIGLSGQASIDKVAGPVGEALIMTAIGLAVAVPAVLGYNLLVRRNKAALEKVQDFSSTLHAVLLSSAPTKAS
ncbi:biopolymer transporter ExbB [Herminiimonas sp. KBW02]|uniref:MotA/TolQ/ExbB proton channel family protein n=1 Tax=Herminiimonas sp. KBW02 TaxID=2153363 RepID=UPI000F595341|nr:MotA/TolQ/ExbB proton channel family protein [Herminiimonas sp. KBW02]RQO34323.1 biopolymer transporter ExbB [Herminiimonas sp. KBW02]